MQPLLARSASAASRAKVAAQATQATRHADYNPTFNWKARRNAAVRRPENVEGAFWVDQTCIDCDTCRWMSPCFTRQNEQSAVTQQPASREERVRALQALLSCPTNSIHADARSADELKEAQRGLPALIPGVPGVYHCGWHTERSFAATSYLITRPEGNIMVDTPRFNPVLAKQLEELGGVRYIFLTHKDDVGDHAAWQKRFGAVRVLHKGEVTSGTGHMEIELEGQGPWGWSHILTHPNNPHAQQAAAGTGHNPSAAAAEQQSADSSPAGRGAAAAEGEDVQLIFTPGHTSHHVCLYYAPARAMFTGDHLAAPEENGRSQELYVFKDFNWFSFDTQLDSVAKLLDYDWLHVLPGHGRQAHFKDAMGRLAAVSNLLQRHGRAVPAAATIS